MDEYESLSHTKWECKYHVVFIPKCRRKTLYGQLRQHLGEVLRKLAAQKESRIEEGHLLADHVHMMIAIPPKHAVSQVIGFIKASWLPCAPSKASRFFEETQNGLAASRRACSTDKPMSARRWSFWSANSPSARRWRLRSIQTWIVVDSLVGKLGSAILVLTPLSGPFPPRFSC